MADTVKISGLPSATTTTGADYVPIVQGGVTKKAPLNVLGTGAGIDTVSDIGLQAHWSMDSVPEIPDDPAGVTYLQDAWATVDGWVTATGGLSFSGGVLTFVPTSAVNNINKTNLSAGSTTGKTMRVRLRSSLLSNISLRKTGYTIFKTQLVQANVWTLIDGEVGTAADALIWISSDVQATLEIDFIYIGTGAYLPNSLIDNSGNGNHGTIYGATPVKGISGRALAFDGVNDYCLATIPSALKTQYSAFCLATPTDITVAFRRLLHNYGSSPFTLGGWSLYQYGSTFGVETNANGGTNATLRMVTGVFSAGVPAFIGFTFSAGTLTLWKNGVAIGSWTQDITDVGTYPSLFIGTLGVSQLFSGTIDEPRIYNRALSAEEVYSLYMSKGRGPDCQVKSVAPIKDSIVVRDTVGNIQANGFKFPGTQIASTDPNTLDDFEEGTFTPGMTIGGVVMTTYGANNAGKYIKIGGMVSFSLSLHVTNKGAGSGAAVITGLPFTNGNGQVNYTPISIHGSGIAFSGFLQGHADISSTSITIRQITDSGVLTAIQGAALTVPFTLLISGHYYV